MQTPSYSSIISCLHDEPKPIGNIGRGAHYSIFRSVEWIDVNRALHEKPLAQDFAVIWDEDHDERVLDVIEAIYLAGLMSPIRFIGERKGELTVIVSAKFYFAGSEDETEDYRKKLQSVVTNSLKRGDYWSVTLGMFDREPLSPHQTQPKTLINDGEDRVITYIRNIDLLWALGTKPFPPTFRKASE